MPNKPVDKDKLPLNQPRRTPSHPTKSHVVKTKVDGKEKIIRFGEQGASTAGKPKAGESDRMKAKRASFKSRHAKNIAKGPSSAAYWANKTKWAEGGTVESTSGLQDLLDKYALGAVQSTRTVTDALANLTPMGDMSREAARAATLVYPKETEIGGEADAMRHMLFQSELSDKYGELPAYMVGLANEYLRGGLQSPAERRMDLDNDMLGRAFGRTVSDPDERMRMIMDLIDMGGATTLEESELGYAHGGPALGFGPGGSVAKEIAEKLAREGETAAEEAKIRLYRASPDDYVTRGTSFTEDAETARAYQDNPGFGGSEIYSTRINPKNVLDLSDEEDQWTALSSAIGEEIEPSRYAYHFARSLTADDSLTDKLAESGVDWIKFRDDFPEGSKTWIPVSDKAIDNAYENNSLFNPKNMGMAVKNKGGSVAGFGAAGSVTKEIAEKLAKESAAKVSGTLKEAQEMLGITPEGQAAWRASRTGNKQTRVPEVKSAAASLRLGDISTDEYQAIVQQFQPIKPLGAVQNVPTFEDIAVSLAKDPNKSAGIVGVNVDIPDGTKIAARLDIPAYDNYDTWVVSLHDGTKKGGNAVGYGQTAVLNNVNFVSTAKTALSIASEAATPSGEKYNKTTIARMYGDWANHSAEDVQRAATSILEDGDPDWEEIGMNPFRHSYFYRKSDGAPVGFAEQVMQIGPLVLAKKVKTIAIDDPAHLVETPNGPRHFARGGINPKALANYDPSKLESSDLGHAYGGEVMGFAEGGLAQLADKYSKDYYQFPFDDHDEHYLKFAGGGDLAKIMRQWLKGHPEQGLADLKTREKAAQHYQSILADPALANRRINPEAGEDSPFYHDYAQRELDILKPEIALNNFVDGALNKYIKRDYGTDWDPLTTLTPDERHVPEGVNNLARQGEPVLRSRNWPPIRFGSEAGTKKIIDGLRSTTRELMENGVGVGSQLYVDDVYKTNPWLLEKPTDMEFFTNFNPHYGGFPHLIDTLRRTITPDSDLPNELRLNPESLQRMSVLQASKLVGKVNQWDKAQELAASQRLMLNPVKEYESGYKWVKLPNAREPEGLKSVMGLGCKGGWCTQQENQAKAYSNYARGDHLYALLDPEGRPHAQASTFEGGPHDWERDKNLTSILPLSNNFDSQYVRDWMAKDPNYKNQIKGYMQDFAGSNDWTHNDRVDGMNAIDMITTSKLDDYFKGNNQAMPLVMALRNNPANVGGSDAVYLEALRRARQNANQREEKIPAYMTLDQSQNMIQKFMPRVDERERINAQVERLFQKPPVGGYAEGGRAMKDLKDEPAPDIYDSSKRSKTGIDVLDNMLDPYYAMRAGIDAQILPEEVQWTDDDGNMHSYTAPGIANSAMGLGSMLKYFGGPKTPMSDAAVNAYSTGQHRALDHYGLPAREDMGFVTKANLTLGEMLGQIPLVPLSAANKARQGVQAVRGAMPFIKKALMAIPEYLGPTIEPSVSSYLMGTAGGLAFSPAMEGLMRMYEKYSPELEYEVPDTDVRGMLDDMGGPVDRDADRRVAQWVAKQRGPSDERARIADNVRRSMMTPGFAGAGSVTKEIAEKLAKEAAEKAAKEAAENLASREAMGVGKSKRRVESTGKYVGAPSHVDTPQALAAMRTRYLQNMDAGIGGRDWYGDASNWIDSVTNNTAASDMAAKTLGITSQGTNVDTNLGFAINAINQRAAGEPIKTGRFPGNQVPLIEQVLDGSTASLGAKRDPYARNLSVKWNPGLAVHPVHDIWQGRAFGYTHPDGSQWDAGFSPQQHAFMDEETQTIIDKANKAGLGGFSDWDALKAQAAAWTGERINSGDLSPTDASKHYGSFSPKYQAFATHEQAPGAGSGHLQDLLGSSYADRLAYQMDPRSSWLDQKGRDRLYSSTGMLVEPSLRMVGAYTPMGGTLEINPGEVARPLVNQTEGSITPRDRQIMDIVESSRAYIDAQNAGAWHKIIPESQSAMGQRSSLSIPMTTNPTPEMMSDLAALAKQYGMFGVDTGNGVSLINDLYSDLGASRTGTTLGKEVKGQMGADLREIIGDIDPKRQKIDTGYLSYQDVLGVPGTGQATQRFLDKLEENTTLMRSIEPELRQKARANMLRDQEISESTGMPVREDIQRARNILSDGGIDALKKALNDGVVLPAAVMAVLSSLFVLPEQGQESEI